MLAGTGIFAIILLACVFGMLYYSFQNHEDTRPVSNLYSIQFAKGFSDSVKVVVNDSVLFCGKASDSLLIAADGDPRQNMISVSDITIGETFNKDLPVEPTVVRVGNEGGLNVETSRMMSPIH